MKRISLYKSDFKTIDGVNAFEYLLSSLGLSQDEIDDTYDIDIKIDSLKYWKGNDYRIKEF